MKVQVPQFYITFSLGDATSSPDQEDFETLRLTTGGYLIPYLKAECPNICGLDFRFTSTENGTEKFVIKVAAAVTFSNQKFSQPKEREVLATILSVFNFDQDYWKLVCRLPAFAAVEDVQARECNPPNEGGTVETPAFYAAFVCANEPKDDLTLKEMNRLLKVIIKEASRRLQRKHGGTFQEVSFAMGKQAIGRKAGIPEAKFNLNVEFTAEATFSKNAPTPQDLVETISQCAGSANFQTSIQKKVKSLASAMEMVFCVGRITDKDDGKPLPQWKPYKPEEGGGSSSTLSTTSHDDSSL